MSGSIKWVFLLFLSTLLLTGQVSGGGGCGGTVGDGSEETQAAGSGGTDTDNDGVADSEEGTSGVAAITLAVTGTSITPSNTDGSITATTGLTAQVCFDQTIQSGFFLVTTAASVQLTCGATTATSGAAAVDGTNSRCVNYSGFTVTLPTGTAGCTLSLTHTDKPSNVTINDQSGNATTAGANLDTFGTDGTAPTFAGATSIADNGEGTRAQCPLTCSWSVASDNIGDASGIIYSVYAAVSADSDCNDAADLTAVFGATPTTVTGTTSAAVTVDGGGASVPWVCCGVRSQDPYGNGESNTVLAGGSITCPLL
ncbi:MAG: hypothetical protein HYS22_04570 [Deltaproteobacteria bacterium]|nr:hypothetical protein [Deltaproteobacteria bacterium]